MDLYVQTNHAPGTRGLGPDDARRLEASFAEMPVENPDGTTGIDLHVRRGGTVDGVATYDGDNFSALARTTERSQGNRHASSTAPSSYPSRRTPAPSTSAIRLGTS